MADYIYLVQMDIPAEMEEEFNRIYDTQHVPYIVQAPGVHGCTRYRLESTNAAGLRDWLLDPDRSVDALYVALTRNVSFIPAGTGGAIEAITAEQVERLRELLLADPGVCLIVAGGSLDTTPAGIVPAAIADAVIVVAVRDRTHRTELRRMTETLRLIGARLAGSLLLVPGDRASRQRAAAVVPLEPATSSGVVGTPAERPVTVSSTRRRRRPG